MTVLDFNLAKPASRPVDADDIRARLHADPRRFVQWLFGGRAFCGPHEARIGNVQGEAGASLSIALSGPDAGLWRDHATQEGGDLISLYMSHMGYRSGPDFQLALREIASEFLGDKVTVDRAAWRRSAVERIEEKKQTLGSQPRADLLELGAPVATYRYYDTRGNVMASVVRYEPNGTREGKTFRPYCFRKVDGRDKWMPGAPDLRPLFRLPEITLSPLVVLTEGEGKAEALAMLGIEATTAMQGANSPIEKTDWSPLRGKTVVVWPDNDEPGLDYGRRVAAHLQSIGCVVRMVRVPEGKPSKWDAKDCIADGGDPAALIAAAEDCGVAPVQQPQADVYKLYTLRELEDLPPPSWLINDVLIDNSLCLFWAGSDSFKTFIAIDMAMSIATGVSWHGRAVVAGTVVYVAAEDINGVAKRMVGWRETKGKQLPLADLVLLNDDFTMASPDADKLVRTLIALPHKPRLIVIDTLARTFGAGNEDKTADMNAFVQGCDKLRRATGATVMVVHHTGRNAEKERGNVALRGACDTIFTIKRSTKGYRIKLINTPPQGKQKNFKPFDDIALRLQEVFFQRKDNEESTLIVMADDGAPVAGEPLEDDEATKTDTAPRLGPIEKSILTALEKAAREGRERLGFISLHAMVGSDKGNFGRSLRTLVEKNLVSEKFPDDDPKGGKTYATLR